MNKVSLISFIIFLTILDYFTQAWDFSQINSRKIRQTSRDKVDIKLNTFQMKLDHFDPNNNGTWLLRYYSSNTFFKPNGPLFILNGGEQTINPFALSFTLMSDMAKENGAHMIKIEHRYYGESVPDNYFGFLTVDQALADMAYFIQEYKRLNPQFYNSKVVIFGTSYSGSLAIWMRLKYPNLVHSAVSSSAPVLAKVNFHEYWEEVYKLVGDNCLNALYKIQDQIKNMIDTPTGVNKLRKDYNLTGPVIFKNFQHIIQGIMIYIVNKNYCNSLNNICDALLNPKNNGYNVLLNLRKRERNYIASQSFYDNNNNQLAWFYQLCTHFGFFQSNYLSPFQSQISQCQRTFGPEFTTQVVENGVKRINDVYQGLNIQVTRVISTHGTGDPWHVLGLKPSSNTLSPVIYIEGSAHGKDVFPINYECDTPQMIEAKKAVQFYIKKWLEEY